jgi:predicted transcriptional regulator
MRTTQTIAVSLPPAILKNLDRVGAVESRTRSELVREALHTYFNLRFPVAEASKAELAGIRRGRAEIRRGQYVSVEQLADELASPRRKARSKSARQDAR